MYCSERSELFSSRTIHVGNCFLRGYPRLKTEFTRGVIRIPHSSDTKFARMIDKKVHKR